TRSKRDWSSDVCCSDLVSVMDTNFTNSNSLEALKLLFRYLRRSYNEGKNDPVAREKVHYAATIAGMAFANAFLGMCHSMAHKLEIGIASCRERMRDKYR